jgi:hypothetical protein
MELFASVGVGVAGYRKETLPVLERIRTTRNLLGKQTYHEKALPGSSSSSTATDRKTMQDSLPLRSSLLPKFFFHYWISPDIRANNWKEIR